MDSERRGSARRIPVRGSGKAIVLTIQLEDDFGIAYEVEIAAAWKPERGLAYVVANVECFARYAALEVAGKARSLIRTRHV